MAYAAKNAGLAASLMEIERDRLLCSLQHLERSVKELKHALIEDPDPEYKTAISENLVVIAKQRARVASLEDEIKRAKGMKCDISHAQVAAVPVTDTAPVSNQQYQHMGNAGGSAPMQVDPAAAGGMPANSAQQQVQQQQQDRQRATEGVSNPQDAGGMWL
jgi:hypothetical protein